MLKYHLMEEQRQSLDLLREWVASAPLLGRIWQGLGRPAGPWLHGATYLLADLVRSGAARIDGDMAVNA